MRKVDHDLLSLIEKLERGQLGGGFLQGGQEGAGLEALLGFRRNEARHVGYDGSQLLAQILPVVLGNVDLRHDAQAAAEGQRPVKFRVLIFHDNKSAELLRTPSVQQPNRRVSLYNKDN